MVRERSSVQSCPAAPPTPAKSSTSTTSVSAQSATRYATKREHDVSNRGKSVEFDRRLFTPKPQRMRARLTGSIRSSSFRRGSTQEETDHGTRPGTPTRSESARTAPAARGHSGDGASCEPECGLLPVPCRSQLLQPEHEGVIDRDGCGRGAIHGGPVRAQRNGALRQQPERHAPHAGVSSAASSNPTSTCNSPSTASWPRPTPIPNLSSGPPTPTRPRRRQAWEASVGVNPLVAMTSTPKPTFPEGRLFLVNGHVQHRRSCRRFDICGSSRREL